MEKNIKNALREGLTQQEDEQTRSNINRIISSYRHIWDIYTELLQNSADAILQKYGDDELDKGFVRLSIDTERREITIHDNGIGIGEDQISKIIVPGKSLKRENKSGRFGFMGFGFSFIAFQTESLKIESTNSQKKASRTYLDLYKFIYGDGEIPNSYEEENNIEGLSVTEDSQTTITVRFPQNFPEETV